MRFAYADPPYIGEAYMFPERREVDHEALLAQLDNEYDGWALSCHVPSLRYLLTIAPPRARICAWVKPFARNQPGPRLQWHWEPVLMVPLRAPKRSVNDFVVANAELRRGVPGAKPPAFADWLFGAAGLRPGDELVDLFPGSGGISRAWARWRTQPMIGLPSTRTAQRTHIVSWFPEDAVG